MERRNQALLVSAALSLTMTSTLAADPASIERPVFKPGTTWRTLVTDGISKARISDTTYNVASVSDSEVVIHDAAGQPAIVLDTVHYAVKRAAPLSFDPPLQRLRFPLAVGDRWETDTRYEHAQCGPTQSRFTYKAVAWDDITTPAGKFRALRIEAEARIRNSCPADALRQKSWFAPDLAVPLRLEQLVYAFGRVVINEVQELQSLDRP